MANSSTNYQTLRPNPFAKNDNLDEEPPNQFDDSDNEDNHNNVMIHVVPETNKGESVENFTY